MTTFAMTGVAGFVAPRHLEAIKAVDGQLVAALDPNDSVGILDKYDRTTRFFTSPERFERFLASHSVDWMSVCSPNHLHDVHARLGMQNGANVICEKPLVLSPWNLDALEETERKTGKRVYTVLQLRHLTKLQSLSFALYGNDKRFTVQLTYVTPRGPWYHQSWKGDVELSGGLVTNIGIHMLDMLLWLYGPCSKAVVTARTPTYAKGLLQLERADVAWLLSIDSLDAAGTAIRSLTVDGEKIEFSDFGFNNLHSTVYSETLAGRGHGISTARPAIELAHRLRHLPVSP
jgi:UDP-N-acetyl-2-amino-2-deoxyglucuronate dehydrogenase